MEFGMSECWQILIHGIIKARDNCACHPRVNGHRPGLEVMELSEVCKFFLWYAENENRSSDKKQTGVKARRWEKDENGFLDSCSRADISNTNIRIFFHTSLCCSGKNTERGMKGYGAYWIKNHSCYLCIYVPHSISTMSMLHLYENFPLNRIIFLLL